MVEAGSDDDLLIPSDTGGTILVLNRDGNLLGGANGKDSGLGRVDDGSEALDGGVHAHVGDGDAAALVLLGLELAVAGLLGELLDGGRDALETLALDTLDDGGDEAVGGGDGNGNVDGLELADDTVAPRAVDGRDALGSNTHGLDEEVIDGKLVAAIGRAVERLAELEELADGEVGGNEEVGVLRDGLLQAGGNGLAHARDGDISVGSGGTSSGSASKSLLDILLGDLATRTGALDVAQVDTLLASKSLGSREGVGLALEGSLEAAGEASVLGLGSGSRSGGRGAGGALVLGLILGDSGGGLAAGILESEVLEGVDVGTLLDENGNGLEKEEEAWSAWVVCLH